MIFFLLTAANIDIIISHFTTCMIASSPEPQTHTRHPNNDTHPLAAKPLPALRAAFNQWYRCIE